MESAWICSPIRTPFCRATKGAFAETRPDDLLIQLFKTVLSDHPGVRNEVDDVIVGCAYPEAEQGRNVARAIAIASGVPDHTPAMTLTRMCASSLEATAIAGNKVRVGEADLVLVGGMESMSRIPMGGVRPSPNPQTLESRPEVYINMGETAERVARKYDISRTDKDAWALRSHQRATTAREKGVFAEDIRSIAIDGDSGRVMINEDDAIRPNTSLERLAALNPAFAEDGSVTAGNSCPTSDGASALLVASTNAVQEHGLRPLGRLVSYAVAGVDPALMGIGPVQAVPLALKRAQLNTGDIDRIELNEAFASQVLAVVRGLDLPVERLNVNGGALALGHPLGATGGRLVGTLLRELQRSNGQYGLATLCVGGGMGAAMIVESTAASPI